MGNKHPKRKRPVTYPKIKIPEYHRHRIKVIDQQKLDKLRHKCRKLKSKGKVGSSAKLELVRKALPGVKMLFEPLKTFYSLDKSIMTSNFGNINKAYCKKDLDSEIMVKIIHFENLTSHLFLVIQGLVQLQRLSHPNICNIKSMLFDSDKLYLVMNYDNYVTLSDFVIDQEKLSEKQTVEVIHQLLKVVQFLNENNIVHRDLRPENILVNPETLEVKLPNFEFSTFFQENEMLKTKLGSAYYMAPEVLEKSYGKECDMWSIGAITYFCLIGFPPFLADTPAKVMEEIKNFKLNFVIDDWEEKSGESYAFIRKSLVVDPKSRLTVGEGLAHPFISDEFCDSGDANPQEIGFDFDEKSFDIFLREIFAILLENYDVDMLIGLKEAYETLGKIEIFVHDLLSIVENTEAYDEEIKTLLREGLKKIDSHIDCTEFLESVIEEKHHLDQPEFDADFVFSQSSNTNTSNTETSSDSSSPVKIIKISQ